MTCSAQYAPRLRLLGFRVTSQRLVILHVLRHASGHLSPTEIHVRARQEMPALTATTVYRTLEFLRRTGLAWRTARASGHVAYELADGHHHHLTCRNCGREVALHDAAVEGAFKRLEAASGYAIDHEHVSLSGLCPRCRAASDKV